MLLIATLFRLSLNVAATRLILSDANAGHVIESVGQHVVGGNYIIGIIVFLILVVVQYVVVTAGAQRVAEVAARFTLDSMPGRQMSIDADLNMGFIDQAEAQTRRKSLEKEANFYGAMDGASKFVKGDAIAGVIILAINILGGFAIGVMQHGMPWQEALQRYVLLTIGDGIVTQVPALVISIGTGIIVTRSVGDSRLSNEILRQLAAHPRTLLLVGAVLFAMMFMPGMPIWPMMVLLGVLAIFMPLVIGRAKKARQVTPEKEETSDAYLEISNYAIDIRAGENILALGVKFESQIIDQCSSLRKKIAKEMGVVIPEVVIRKDEAIDPDVYRIYIKGACCGEGVLYLERVMAIAPKNAIDLIDGIAVADPAYGLPAVWVEPAQKAAAQDAGYTTADAMTVFFTHFVDTIRRNLPSLLTRAETERLVNRIRANQPTLVEELVPNILTLSDVQRVLQGLLQEEIPILNIEQILEVLVDQGRQQKDPVQLIERVRQRLSAIIYQSLLGNRHELKVITLDPATELAIAESLRNGLPSSGMILNPRLAEQLVFKLSDYAERTALEGAKPVLICQPDVRRGIRSFLERIIPHLAVLAINELPAQAKVRSDGVLQLSPIDS